MTQVQGKNNDPWRKKNWKKRLKSQEKDYIF